MTATDSELYRAFAGRVRTTVATTPEGSPTMNDTTTVETGEVPATFQAALDTACGRGWCVETRAHLEHVGRVVNLPEVSAQIWQDTDDAQPTIVVGNPQDDYQSFTSGQQLRERAAQIRGGSARLDALADEYDALREAEGDGETAPSREKIRRVVVETGPVPPQGIVVYTQQGDELHVIYDPQRASLSSVADHVGYMLGDKQLEGLILQAGALTEKPQTWSFTDLATETQMPYTCMLGCPDDHRIEQSAPYQAADASCWLQDAGADVPVEAVGQGHRTETVLGIITKVEPWAEHKPMSARLPHVDIEVVEDCFIKGLDPDGLQVVIDLFQSRVDAMRAARLHLIAARAQWLQQRDGGTR